MLFLHEQWLKCAGYTSPWVITFSVIHGICCSNWTVTSYFLCWLHPWNKLFKNYHLLYQLLTQASKTWIALVTFSSQKILQKPKTVPVPVLLSLSFRLGTTSALSHRRSCTDCTLFCTLITSQNYRPVQWERLHTGHWQKCRNITGGILCLSFVLQTLVSIKYKTVWNLLIKYSKWCGNRMLSDNQRILLF